MIKYTTFSFRYFYLSLLFFIFNNVAQYNRFNFISSYGRKQPPNNGRRTGGEKWVSSYRWEKATGRDFVIVIFYCLLIKYILILVHNFLDHFDLKVFKESTKYASIRTLVVIAHSCDHLQSWNIFSVISATEESQVTSSDAELDVYNDPLRGKKTRWSKIVWKTPQWSFFFHIYIKICLCSVKKFLRQQKIFFFKFKLCYQ